MLSEEMAGDWERVTDPLIEPILALASECGSYAEFNKRLPEVIGRMDTRPLVTALAQSTFAARLLGRLND